MFTLPNIVNKFHQSCCVEFLKQVPDNSVDMVISSPPYPGVESMWGKLFAPENFDKAHDFLDTVWDQCLRVLKPGCKMAINIANTKRRPYLPNTYRIYKWALGKCEPVGELIWHKGFGTCGTSWGSYCDPADPALADQHEYIIIARKFGERNKDKKTQKYSINAREFKSWRNSIWNISPAKASKVGHIAPFPLEIPHRLILLYTYKGEIVLDPFMGSGTTALAAEKNGRKWIGIENNAEYVKLSEDYMKAETNQIKMFTD